MSSVNNALASVQTSFNSAVNYVSTHGKPLVAAASTTMAKVCSAVKAFFVYIGDAAAKYAKIYWPKITAAVSHAINISKAWVVANPIAAQVMLCVGICALAFFATKALLNWSKTPETAPVQA